MSLELRVPYHIGVADGLSEEVLDDSVVSGVFAGGSPVEVLIKVGNVLTKFEISVESRSGIIFEL